MNSHLPIVRKPGKATAAPVEPGNIRGRLDDELTSRRFLQTEVVPLLLSLACVGLVTAVLVFLDQHVAVNLVPIAYLIPVIIAATQWGIWPATLASIVSMAAADFFFFPPIFSFQVEDPQEVVDLLLFLVVALVSSNLASRLRRETDMLRRREKEIQNLYEFSRRLAACFTVSDLIAAIQTYLSGTLGQPAVFFVAKTDGQFELPNSGSSSGSMSGSVPKVVHDSVAALVATVGVPARTLIDEPTQNVWLLRAVGSETAVHGLVAINIGGGSRTAIDIRTRHVEAILEEVSLTLQRIDIEKAMEDARLRLQAQLLRDAFHGTLSHELCSPLAAIQGSASVLGTMSPIQNDPRAQSLVEGISDEVAELNGFIQNLLNATRVTAGGVSPNLEWADPRDIINAAIRQRIRRLVAHRIETEFAENLPLVNVDSGLIEESCGQLLENAAKYSPSGSTISVNAKTEQGHVILSISDQGVGITPDEQQFLGRRSFRSQRHQATIPGSGLGFWIASTFVAANGGTIAISSPGQGLGTTASITLPASEMDLSEITANTNE